MTLARGIAEEARRAGVPSSDDPVHVLAHDRLLRRIHDRSHVSQFFQRQRSFAPRLGFAQFAFNDGESLPTGP